MGEICFYRLQSLALCFPALELCDGNVGSDIAGKFPSPGVSRNATFHHPPVFSIRSPEAIFHGERFSRLEGRQEAIEAALHIVRMHTFDPSHAYFLLHGSVGELEPWLIEIVAKAIRSGHPDQHRRRIRHRLEPGFALTQASFSALPFGDVAVSGVIDDLLAGRRSHRNCEKRYVNLSPILASSNRLDLYSPTLL